MTDSASIEPDCPTEVCDLLAGTVGVRGADELNAWRDQMAPLGHQLTQLATAVRNLRRRADRGRLPPPLAAFVARSLPAADLSCASEHTPSTVLLRESGGELRVESTSIPELTPGVWALLRLPSVRRLWETDLRRAHVQRLAELSPDLWVMDATPVPPGAVIAGLGLPSWEHFPRQRGRGRVFEISTGAARKRLDDGTEEAVWEGTVAQALAAGNGVLRELHRADAWWWGEWELRDRRVELIRLRRATLEAGTWQVVRLDP